MYYTPMLENSCLKLTQMSKNTCAEKINSNLIYI
jgi:hypothetical protein